MTVPTAPTGVRPRLTPSISAADARSAEATFEAQYRRGWDDGYDAGYATARADALNDPMTFCVCSAARCEGVEGVEDGTADSCWLCTFLDGEAPCPAYVES